MRANNDPTASGTTFTYTFGNYCKNVLPNEWVCSWPAESLKVGAISVRSFAWYCTNYPKYPNLGADVDNTVNSQVFKPNTAQTSTNNAFSSTTGMVINRWVNSVGYEEAGFSKAGTYGSARDSSSYSFYNNVYQNGTHYFSDNGQTFSYMTGYYYPGTTLSTGNGF